jgi:steroid delta-isomerase-like uncharacterized protein
MMRYNQLWAPGGLSRAEAVLGAGFVRHGSSGELRGVAAFKRYAEIFQTAFPDARFTVEDLVAQGDKIVVRYGFTGTHRGPFLGLPVSGRTLRAEGVSIYRVGEGKVQELWDFLDLFDLAAQLGALPPEAGPLRIE